MSPSLATSRGLLLSVAAVLVAVALACGGDPAPYADDLAGLPADVVADPALQDTGAAALVEEPGAIPGMAGAPGVAGGGVAQAATGAAHERACKVRMDCGCPGGQAEYQKCVQDWSVLLLSGYREATAECYASLSCEHMCATSPTAASMRCNEMLAQDQVSAAATMQGNMQDRSHETQMGIINNMGAGKTTVTDQYGNKQYEY